MHLTDLLIFYYRCIWYLRQSFGPTYDKILIGGKFLASLALLKVDKVSESISLMYSVCNVELNMSDSRIRSIQETYSQLYKVFTENHCAHWWQMWRASVLFPPGDPSIRHTLPGDGGGGTTRGDHAGSGKRL